MIKVNQSLIYCGSKNLGKVSLKVAKHGVSNLTFNLEKGQKFKVTKILENDEFILRHWSNKIAPGLYVYVDRKFLEAYFNTDEMEDEPAPVPPKASYFEFKGCDLIRCFFRNVEKAGFYYPKSGQKFYRIYSITDDKNGRNVLRCVDDDSGQFVKIEVSNSDLDSFFVPFQKPAKNGFREYIEKTVRDCAKQLGVSDNEINHDIGEQYQRHFFHMMEKANVSSTQAADGLKNMLNSLSTDIKIEYVFDPAGEFLTQISKPEGLKKIVKIIQPFATSADAFKAKARVTEYNNFRNYFCEQCDQLHADRILLSDFYTNLRNKLNL